MGRDRRRRRRRRREGLSHGCRRVPVSQGPSNPGPSEERDT
ncbi:Hypothetical protein AA314_09718 [Archangium gephyra]|uniref:Uncharacterized protein n=1 Tax=Archangium gephyra TaxID=48 RepID=A0AAC8QI24_9BACT|nr:Hypothetical protein AA314_09718 [Archangium gephyra]